MTTDGEPEPATYDQDHVQTGLPRAAGLLPSWHSHNIHHPQLRQASTPQPLITLHNHAFMQNQEPPQLPSDGPYGQQTSLPAPRHTPSEAPPPPHAHFHAMNGALPGSSPLPTPPESTRARMSQDQSPHTRGDPPPPPQSPILSQYAVPPVISYMAAPYKAGYDPKQRHRKATRALRACDQCRAKKGKCDEGRPACSYCKESNLICVYKEVPPDKQERYTQLILDRLQQLEDQLDTRLRGFERLHAGHDQILDQISATLAGNPDGETQNLAQYPVINVGGVDVPQNPERMEQVILAADGGRFSDPSAYTKELFRTGDDGELSIPVEHTTAAIKLLGWPSITKVLHRYDDDYALKLERSRGLVRLTGRGEAQDTDDGISSQPTSFNTSLDENLSPPNGTSNTKYNHAPPERRGIDAHGLVAIDAEEVRRYRDSYFEHIHKLHPFLYQHDLEQKIERFIAKHCPKDPESAAALSAKNSAEAPRNTKRQRPGETLQGTSYGQRSPPIGQTDGAVPHKVQRSIGNAIILLVLALGRICELRDEPIRGACTDRIIDYRNEPIPGAPPRDGVSQDQAVRDQQFITLPDPPRLENVDTVPGLVYYAYAASILGESEGATTLPYVQAALLAGLYTGQLAHPFQSHSWIAQAARACQVLTSPKSYRELQNDHNKDLVNFAYWTCLQLESDILAELSLPASGISRSESRINFPLPNSISAPNLMIMFFYFAQIHLQKIINRVHTDLYKVEKQGEARWSSSVQGILSRNLDQWRSSLPQEMRWSDNDPPSPDINVARMRAKYFSARCIIHRPLLYHALYYCGPNMGRPSVDSLARYGEAVSSQVSPSLTHGQYAPGMTRMPQKLRRACEECLHSAVRSTVAFDAIKGRPVVANIFGTAHAQFGNMLLLSTTYMSHLTDLVDRNELERLLRRTIAFLLRNRNISPTLRADAKILAEIYEIIFKRPPMLAAVDG